jgi:hypothetical protein
MKLKKSEVKSKVLRQRLIKSLTIGVLFIILVVVSFAYIFKGPQEDGAATIHRKSFLLNEKVWSILQSAKRLSVEKKTPPSGKQPRVNGMLGLESPLVQENYKVQVDSGEKHMSILIPEFLTLPKVGYTTDFRCIEGWSEETQYAGARFSDFMENYNLGRKSDGSYYQYVGLETPDGKYYVSIDIESMMHPQTVLAYEMNLSPLSLQNGAPLRLIIPIKYGIKSLKRIGRIFFSDERPKDYWAQRGYDWYSGL